MTTTIANPVAAQAATYTAGYVRLTRDESLQNGLSAPAQRKLIEAYATKANLLPLIVHEETKAVGGDIPFASRPAFRELLAAIKRGECNHIIVRDLDRLTRDVKIGAELLDICLQYRVTLHTPSGPVPIRSASDKFLYFVKSAASQYEKDQTGDRVKRAKREAVEQGRWQGPPAFGFISQARRRSDLIAAGMGRDEAEALACREYPYRGRLYFDLKESEIVRLIYRLSNEGQGSRRIVKYLNENGYRTRTGGFWSTERLSRTLNNPAAAGYLTYDVDNDGGTPTPKQKQRLFKGNHEAIVTLDEWKKIQVMRSARTDLMRNRGDTKQVGRQYPLSGVIHCECGSPMRGSSIRSRDKQGRYACSRARYHGKGTINGCPCQTTTINAGRVHEVFWPKLRELLACPDLIDRIYAVTQKILRGEKNRKVEDRDLHHQIKKLETQIGVWYARHDGTDSEAGREAAWNRIQQLTVEKKRLEGAKLEKETTVQNVTRITRVQIEKYLGSLSSLMTNHGGDEAKHYVQSLVTHHGLQVRMTAPEMLSISLAIKSPGTMGTQTVTAAMEAPLHKDKYGAWVQEQQHRHSCCLCGKPIEIRRRHFWLGVPKHHHKCWAKDLARKRNQRDDGLLTGAAVARLLGVGESTIGRWRKSGKLPEPTKRERGTVLWHPDQVSPVQGVRSSSSAPT